MWVSQDMWERGVVQVGITNEATPGSDHRGYVVDIDTAQVMGGMQIMGGLGASGWRAGDRKSRTLDGHTGDRSTGGNV